VAKASQRGNKASADLPECQPEPTLKPAACCGVMVLTRLASTEEVEVEDPKTHKPKTIRRFTWRVLDPPLSPVTGRPHVCEEARALAMIAQGARWSTPDTLRAYEQRQVTLRQQAAQDNPWLTKEEA
jgi:hypothetical protein